MVVIHSIIIFVIIISTFTLPVDLQAEKDNIKFEHFSLEEGLSQATVWSILQDRHGFMWFGTADGLNKYNGYNFEIYKHDPFDSTSLPDNRIMTIFEDKSGVIWVGTSGGVLSRLSRNEKGESNFIHYKHNPTKKNSLSKCSSILTIFEDECGILWIGTQGGGLVQLDKTRQNFKTFKHKPEDKNSLCHNTVTSIAEAPDENNKVLWIGTANGLSRLSWNNQEQEEFSNYLSDPLESNSLSHNFINVIHKSNTRENTLWIGTDDGLNELITIDENGEVKFVHHKNNLENPTSLSSDIIWSIYEDNSRNLWVGTNGGGLNRHFLNKTYPGKNRHFIHYKHDPLNPKTLNNNLIRSIFQDNTGAMWFGTNGGGVNKFNSTIEKFKHYKNDPNSTNSLSDNNVYSILQDKTCILWIGTKVGGLNKLDREKATFTIYKNNPLRPGSLSNNNVMAIHESKYKSDENIWMGTNGGGLSKFNKKHETFIHYKNEPDNPHSLTNNRVKRIYEPPSGQGDIFWIGTYGGLARFDVATESFINFEHDPTDSNSLSNNRVMSIYEDKSGVLWVGTYGGLNKLFIPNKRESNNNFIKEKVKFIHYNYSQANPKSINNILTIYEDLYDSNILWIGTFGGGFSKFDKEKEEFTNYTEREGLANNVVYGILGDKSGNLWLSTNKGISRFNPKNNLFKNYVVNDGLQSNEFNTGAYFRSHTGELFFGGINGFNSFYPDSIKDNLFQPPVVITNLKIFDELVESDIIGYGDIELSYKENYLSIEFVALNYTNSPKNQYAYMMSGIDNDWIYSGTRRFVTYTNMDPGAYIFKVKGSNNDGVWNEDGTILSIIINPPIWQTWWAYLSYIVLFIMSIFSLIKFRTRQIEQRNRELEDTVKERTKKILDTQEQLIIQEKMASLGQMTAGIAHEIKNPLNFVTNFSEATIGLADELKNELINNKDNLQNLDYDELSEIIAEITQNSDDISSNSKRADSIIQSMMLHTRGEKGERRSVDINFLLDENVKLAYHGFRAQDASFNVTIEKDYDENIGTHEVIHQDLGRVFLNILNNACYAVREKQRLHGDDYSPTLSVSTRKLNDGTEIRIRDNGLGISPENRDKIFEPFFTTKPTGEGNTGLGLSISYDIIMQGHNGNIDIKSESGEFTEFIITLPKSGGNV